MTYLSWVEEDMFEPQADDCGIISVVGWLSRDCNLPLKIICERAVSSTKHPLTTHIYQYVLSCYLIATVVVFQGSDFHAAVPEAEAEPTASASTVAPTYPASPSGDLSFEHQVLVDDQIYL